MNSSTPSTIIQKIQKQNPDAKTQNSTNFLRKLYDIVENPNHQDLVKWSENGQAVKIIDSESFAKAILPIYFKHKSFSSFIRQLNMYDFKKQRSDDSQYAFAHPLFQKGQRAILNKIKRKNPSRLLNTTKTYKAKTNIQNLEPEESLQKMVHKEDNYTELSKKVEGLEKKVGDLMATNQSLTRHLQNLHFYIERQFLQFQSQLSISRQPSIQLPFTYAPNGSFDKLQQTFVTSISPVTAQLYMGKNQSS